MYQTSLSDNPQQDVQAALRIFRIGQTKLHAYLYRIMINTHSERHKLLRQELKAGGWRQRFWNVDNACEILDIPESWAADEPVEEEKESEEDV